MRREFALPGTRPRYAPDRVVDVEHIKIDIELDVAKGRIAGTCFLTVSPILEGVQHLELDAVELVIASVSLPSGTKLDFSHDGRKLRIDLGRRHKAGDSVVLAVAYRGEPRRGLYFIGPDKAYPDRPVQVWSQGQDEDSRYWFPCFDSPNEKATSEVRATVPADFFVLSNGDLVETQAGKNTKTFHWKFDTPHSCYLITLAAGRFAEIKDKWEDIELTYYVEPGREAEAKRSLGRTPEMMALFSERFGVRYPYSKYAQVCVADFIFGGMENTTATTLTDLCLFDERASLDFDMEGLVAHELAHQWLGDLVTCRDWGQGWLNEGWATYSEYLWREHAHGEDEAKLALAAWANSYFGEDANRYRRPIATNLFDAPIDVFDHHLYDKGGLVLHMLRQLLGDDVLWNAVRHYLEKHRNGSVETRDFVRALEEATGKNLDWFFEQWIHKAGHPEFTVEYAWDPAKLSARITVKQTQKVEGDTPLFRVPTHVRFRVKNKDVTLPIEISDAFEVFHFTLDAEPTQVIFDPGQHTLKRCRMEKARNLWLAELASATQAIDRIQAAKALAKHAAEDVVVALEKALASDKFWGVRAAAAESLGALRMDTARDALASAAKTCKLPKARKVVMRALGAYRHDDVAARVLEDVVKKGDESYFVEAEACLALGRTRSPRAKAALRDALKRDSYLDVIRQNAYRGLAAARDEDGIELLIAGTVYGGHSPGRRAALMALAELCHGRRDTQAIRGRECIEELLLDKDFRVQQACVEALGVLGDTRAISALRRASDRDLDGRIRRRAREVIRDLQERRGKEEAVKSLRDEVEAMRKEMYGLRDRLGKVETQEGGSKKMRRGNGAKKSVKR